MSKDIGPILDGWEYDPDSVSVRIVRGRDGRDKVQMRVDLGLLQMEMDGRPDGARPHGYESFLDYLEAKAVRLRRRGRQLVLSSQDCDELLREGIQYYYRYLSFFHLSLFELAERDTRRNLQLFAFVRKHAAREEDRWRFDQYRPYVTMMNTQARASVACQEKRFREAVAILDEGIQGIKQFLQEHELEEHEDECIELMFLKRRREQIARKVPLSPVEKLKRKLDRAVAREDYEQAAQLRDRIRRLESKS